MSIKAFLKLTEIQTKVASVIPYFLGLAYTAYAFRVINVPNMIIMFFSMIIFDMTVTSINNYYDYKRAVKKEGYNYEVHNSIVQNKLKESTVIITILIMLAVSAGLGLWLVARTNWVVLVLGAASFVIGIFYSFGVMPISRTPFGEVVSGITMGFVITFIVIYINVFDLALFNLALDFPRLTADMDIWQLFGIGLITLPAILGIANIMLSNNICDIEDDIHNKRHTLPVIVGKAEALKILELLYYAGYVAIVVAVVLRFLPLYSLLVLLTLIPVVKNIRAFKAKSTKKDTFGLCVANFVLPNVVLVLTLGLGILDRTYFHLLA